MESRQLIIRPLCLKSPLNTDKLGNLSPYVRVAFGDQNKSTPHSKEGFNWDAEFIFNLSKDSVITFEVWNWEKIMANDFIGRGTLDLSRFLSKENHDLWTENIKLTTNNGQDAGTLEVIFEFCPSSDLSTQASINTLAESQRLDETPTNVEVKMKADASEPLLATPNVTTETRVIIEEPVITKGNPLVFERIIIHEKPVITERTIIHSEQPIIIEKPELREKVINETLTPQIITEQPIYRKEEALMGEDLGKPQILNADTEIIQDEPVIHRERPVVYQKDIITEQPIIHEKDIIYREKPVFIEKPEIVEKHIYESKPTITETYDTIFKKEEEYTRVKPVVEDAIIEREDAAITRAEPEFMKERPDIHETQIIHEKRLIHEKPIVHTEKEEIHERPEVHEREIFHRGETLHQRDPATFEKEITIKEFLSQSNP